MTLVRYDSNSRVATVTMDRRSAHNALNNELCSELREAWQRFHDSDDRVAVLASAEDDYYTVGADVNGLPDNMWHAVPGLGVALDKPVIAATSGWVVGGGFVLVQMADMCVASETTRFIYPEAKIGITAGGISSVLARMPHKVAMELLLLGEEISVKRAYDVGFVNKVVPLGEERQEGRRMAKIIAESAPLVIRTLRDFANQTLPRGPAEVFVPERYKLERIAGSEDRKEGAAAFREKRAARFKGR